MSTNNNHFSDNGHDTGKPHEQTTSSRDEVMRKAADDLTDAMLALLEPLQTFLLAVLVKRNDFSMRDLTRSLILSRSGEGFEPAVQHAIRNYRNAYEEILRVKDNKELSEASREDILAGFNRLLMKNAEDLEFLGVEVIDIMKGDALDLSIHQVLKRFPANCKRQVGTVKRCVSPGFRWMSVNWSERIKHAEVWAYTECREKLQNASPLSTERDLLGDQLNLS